MGLVIKLKWRSSDSRHPLAKSPQSQKKPHRTPGTQPLWRLLQYCHSASWAYGTGADLFAAGINFRQQRRADPAE